MTTKTNFNKNAINKIKLENKHKVVPFKIYTLMELWDDYVDTKKSRWSPSYVLGDILETEKHLNNHPINNPEIFDEILAFSDYLQDTCKSEHV